jgi:hypothetical protein
MKKILFFLFLCSSITALAQNEVAEDTTAQPAITEKGKPDGDKTGMQIGKDGGSLISSDGKLELIIPPGALSKKTDISIQPVTNLMPNGNGKAYSLEPSGIRFQEPVQLIFHYSPEDAEDTMQLLMGIATQDDKGQWYGLKNFTLDTIAKTLTGNIPHFSTWSHFTDIKINPRYHRVKVNKQLDLEITLIQDEKKSDKPAPSTGPDDDALEPLKPRKFKATWSANGISNGNKIAGWITNKDITTATYKAPAVVPDQDPVAVSAKLQGITFKYRGITFKDLKLVSNILVFDDAYEIEMRSQYDVDAGTVLGKATYTDFGWFVIAIEKGKARLIEKENRNTEDIFGYAGCKTKVINKDVNHGLIHITGVSSIILNPPNPPGQPYATVDIQFIPVPVSLSSLHIRCIDKKGKITEMNTPQSMPMPAFPIRVMFELKEGEQILRGSIDQPEMKFKMIARPVKEDRN